MDDDGAGDVDVAEADRVAAFETDDEVGGRGGSGGGGGPDGGGEAVVVSVLVFGFGGEVGGRCFGGVGGRGLGCGCAAGKRGFVFFGSRVVGYDSAECG